MLISKVGTIAKMSKLFAIGIAVLNTVSLLSCDTFSIALIYVLFQNKPEKLEC